MNFEEAKKHKQEIEEKNKADSKKLQKFEKNALGLTPDHIRELPEWEKANEDFERSFAELRSFNGWYVKTFKKEIQANRRKN